MTTNVGVNGFGRVGRQFLRASLASPDVVVVAINDPFLDAESVANAIRYDSAAGRHRGTVEVKAKNLIIVDGRRIAVSGIADPSQIPWCDTNVSYVVESSGVYSTSERAAAHLAGGAQRVIITGPSADAPPIVLGANEDSFKGSMQVISAGSCTAVALCPPLKMLHAAFGITSCMFTAIHCSSTGRVTDSTSAKAPRAARSTNNVAPVNTTAMKTLVRALPNIASKVTGTAVRVPTANVCLLDMTVTLDSPASKNDVDALFRGEASATEASNAPSPSSEASPTRERHAASGAGSTLIGFTTDPVVSGDFIGDTHACVYDADASIALPNTIASVPAPVADPAAAASTHKLMFWYDNERGYAQRLVDLIARTRDQW